MLKEIIGINELNDCTYNTDKLIIFDCYAEWCKPCQQLLPELIKLQQTYNNILIYKVNIDKNNDISDVYDITSLPTLIFFKNKKRLGEFIGSDIEQLKKIILELI